VPSWQPPELEVGHRASWLLDTWKKQGDPRWQVDQALRSEARRQLIDEHNESDPVLTGEFVQEVERAEEQLPAGDAERDQARQNLAAHLVIDRLQVQVTQGVSPNEGNYRIRRRMRGTSSRGSSSVEAKSHKVPFGRNYRLAWRFLANPILCQRPKTVSWRMSLGEHVHLRIKRLLRY